MDVLESCKQVPKIVLRPGHIVICKDCDWGLDMAKGCDHLITLVELIHTEDKDVGEAVDLAAQFHLVDLEAGCDDNDAGGRAEGYRGKTSHKITPFSSRGWNNDCHVFGMI